MKALGVVVDQRLHWTEHIDIVVKKIRGLLCGLRIQRKTSKETSDGSSIINSALCESCCARASSDGSRDEKGRGNALQKLEADYKGLQTGGQ